MKKPTLIALLLFVMVPLSAYSGQPVWIEYIPNVDDPEYGPGTGKIMHNGKIYDMAPNANLRGVDFSNVRFSHPHLEINLEGADLSGANLQGARFVTNWHLKGANLSNANVIATGLANEIWRHRNVEPSENLEGANLNNVYLGEGFWVDQEIFNPTGSSRLHRTGKIRVNGKTYEIGPNKNLSGANLSNAELMYVDLRGANLSGANLSGANLYSAELWGANVTGADFSEAVVFGDKFGDGPINSDLSRTKFDNTYGVRGLGVISVGNVNSEEGNGGGITDEQAASITSNTNKVYELGARIGNTKRCLLFKRKE